VRGWDNKSAVARRAAAETLRQHRRRRSARGDQRTFAPPFPFFLPPLASGLLQRDAVFA